MSSEQMRTWVVWRSWVIGSYVPRLVDGATVGADGWFEPDGTAPGQAGASTDEFRGIAKSLRTWQIEK